MKLVRVFSLLRTKRRRQQWEGAVVRERFTLRPQHCNEVFILSSPCIIILLLWRGTFEVRNPFILLHHDYTNWLNLSPRSSYFIFDSQTCTMYVVVRLRLCDPSHFTFFSFFFSLVLLTTCEPLSRDITPFPPWSLTNVVWDLSSRKDQKDSLPDSNMWKKKINVFKDRHDCFSEFYRQL